MTDLADVVVPSWGMGQPNRITPETEGHWRAAAEGSFTAPTCDVCGTRRWPVSHVCYVCGSMGWSWRPVAGTGRVYTYTWIDTPTHAGADVQNVALIELDGTQDEPVRVPGWVAGVARDELCCDLPVVVEFGHVAAGVAVPYWVPRKEPNG